MYFPLVGDGEDRAFMNEFSGVDRVVCLVILAMP